MEMEFVVPTAMVHTASQALMGSLRLADLLVVQRQQKFVLLPGLMRLLQ